LLIALTPQFPPFELEKDLRGLHQSGRRASPRLAQATISRTSDTVSHDRIASLDALNHQLLGEYSIPSLAWRACVLCTEHHLGSTSLSRGHVPYPTFADDVARCLPQAACAWHLSDDPSTNPIDP
jgi:hypothetical protein